MPTGYKRKTNIAVGLGIVVQVIGRVLAHSGRPGAVWGGVVGHVGGPWVVYMGLRAVCQGQGALGVVRHEYD